MRLFTRFILLVCLVGSGATAAAQAQMGGERPFLSKNLDGSVCEPFYSEWVKKFDSFAPIDEPEYSLKDAFPSENVWSFPEDRPRGLYGATFSLPVDIDGDGGEEIIYLEPDHIGWRYFGVWLYVFSSTQDYDTAIQSNEHQREGRFTRDGSRDAIPGSSFLLSMKFSPTLRVQIMATDSGVYTMSKPVGPSQSEPRRVGLFKLFEDRQAEEICTVDLLPPIPRLRNLRSKSRPSVR